jgi:hypothetical protein
MDQQAVIRRTRIAVSVVFGVLTLALVMLWVRSYSTAHRLHGVVWRPTSFVLASQSGRVSLVVFRWHGAADWWRWKVLSYPVDDELSFPCGGPANYERRLGFGWLRDPLYMVMRSTQTLADGTEVNVWGAATATLSGAGPMVPYWFLVGAFTVLSVATACPVWGARRFSLRTMLVITTCVAVALGLSVWLLR